MIINTRNPQNFLTGTVKTCLAIIPVTLLKNQRAFGRAQLKKYAGQKMARHIKRRLPSAVRMVARSACLQQARNQLQTAMHYRQMQQANLADAGNDARHAIASTHAKKMQISWVISH